MLVRKDECKIKKNIARRGNSRSEDSKVRTEQTCRKSVVLKH